MHKNVEKLQNLPSAGGFSLRPLSLKIPGYAAAMNEIQTENFIAEQGPLVLRVSRRGPRTIKC